MNNQLGPQEVKSLSLYDREAEWKQLEELLANACLVGLNEEGGLETQENAEALVALVEKTFLAVQDKRDSFCSFLAWLEGQQHMGEQEQERLEYRIKRIEAARKRLEKLAIDTIRSLGPDAKGKWKRLEGKTSTLSLAKNPASVEVLDDKLIPDEFKDITIEVKVSATIADKLIATIVNADHALNKPPLISVRMKDVAAALKEMLPCEDCGELGVVSKPPDESEVIHNPSWSVCPKCNGDKQVPRQVPGARLVTDKVRLVRK
ncbi:MAG TPA: siphovirus Gp157 family protein [Bryobacteraceae bacterium]|nr:siphovirus Gp157 family protein [Bryobacteraceae bacterium]